MPKAGEIVLPIGTRIGVLVKDLPKTLAEAIYPRETVSPLVSRIRGKLPDRVPLTPEDWNLLRSFWPSIREVMPHGEFCDFWVAFREWKDKPSGQLWSEDEGGDKLAGLRKDARELFEARVDEAIASGTLIPRNHAGIPTCPNDASYTPGLAWIFPPELEAFAANFHIRVSITTSDDSGSETDNTATSQMNSSSPNLADLSLNATAAVDKTSTDSKKTTASPTCKEFRDMPNLTASELGIAFLAGNSGNNILEISARGVTKRVALVELNLFDRRKANLNEQGVILLGMAQNRSIRTAESKTVRRISRLRAAIRLHLGIIDDPIVVISNVGYEPRFRVTDKRDAANQRAKRDAERGMASLDELTERGLQVPDTDQGGNSFEDEGDDTAEWIKNKQSSQPD